MNDLTPQAPIPVISLKRQVRSDQKTSLLLLIIIEVLTVLGIGTIIIYAGSPFGITIILTVIGTGIAAYCLISLARKPPLLPPPLRVSENIEGTPASSPIALEYRRRGLEDAENESHAVLTFFVALIIGVALSAGIWIGEPKWLDFGNVLVVPGLKFVAGIALLFHRRSRPAAAGILISIPIGVLIFFGACAGVFRI